MSILQQCQILWTGFVLIGKSINYQINTKINQSLLLNSKLAIAEKKNTKTNSNNIQKTANLNT